MGDQSKAFAKGGCGCLLGFAALGAVAVLMGGRVHIDCGGAAFLFVAGGVVGLVALAVYKKGVRAGREQAEGEEIVYDGEPHGGRWWCVACGSMNYAEAKICQRCHEPR